MANSSGLLRTQGTALHRQIFLVLRDGIVQGTYPPGTALPKEEDLVTLFGAARMTVRRALADLEAEGLVKRRHGRGTFVAPDLATGPSTTALSYVDGLKRTAQTTKARVISVESVTPPPSVGVALRMAHDERAMHAVRLRVAGSVTLMVTDAWVPHDIGKSITAAALKKQPMYEILMAQGVAFGRVVQEISAESADPAKAKLLECELSTALIRLTRLLHDRSGRPVYYMTAHITPRHSRILMEIPSDAIGSLSAGHVVHDPEVLSAVDRRIHKSRN